MNQVHHRKITIVNQDSGYLMIDIANAFHNRGYKVNLVTGRLVERNKLLHEDIKVIKIIHYNRKSKANRLLTWLIATIQILFIIWLKLRNNHLLFVSNPPTATILPLFIKKKYSLLIYDVYPDVLTEQGILKTGSLLIKLWQKANKKVFSKAERISTITMGMKNVLGKYIDVERIDVIPIWTDSSFLKPIPKKENSFIRKHGLENKFIILYSGNLGYTHEVEIMLDLAIRIKAPEILFVIIGEGEKKKDLEQRISNEKISNCITLPFQKIEDLPYSLSAAGLAIVSLGKAASMLSVPSKTYNFMSVGAPMLCITETESELAYLTAKYNFGKAFSSDQMSEMLDFINELSVNKELLNKYQVNSLRASKDFGPENAEKFIFG